MSSFAVKTCKKREREPTINGSKMFAYIVEFETGEKAELLQKPETPAPTPGQVLEGEIQPGKEKDDGTKWPDKFKKAGGQGGSGYKPRSPQETASIVRQHSQEMAIRWLALMNPDSINKANLIEAIEWFDRDVREVQVAAQSVEKPVDPKPREAAPEIPVDRAEKILKAATKKKLAQVTLNDDDEITGVTLTPSFQTKLIDVGCETGKINNLTVDQAEAVETWIEAERV